MKKRIVALMMISVLALSVCACGEKEEVTTNSTTETSVTTDSTASTSDAPAVETTEEEVATSGVDFKTDFDNCGIRITTVINLGGEDSIKTTTISEGIMDLKNQKQVLSSTTSVMGLEVTSSTYVDYATGMSYTSVLNGELTASEGGTRTVDLDGLKAALLASDDLEKNGDYTYCAMLDYSNAKGVVSPEYAKDLEGKDIPVLFKIENGYLTEITYTFDGLGGINEMFTSIDFYDFNSAGDVAIPEGN